MAICEKCGKEIPEGGVCDCEQNVTPDAAGAAPENPAPVTEPVPQETVQAAAENVQAAADTVQAAADAAQSPYENAVDATPEGLAEAAKVVDGAPQAAAAGAGSIVDKFKANPKLLILIAIPVVLIILLGVLLIVSTLAGGYKKPINDFVYGFNHNDGEKVLTSMLPSDTIKEIKDELKDEGDITWKEAMEEFDEMLEDSKEDYGKHTKLTVKINGKTKADRDELRSLRSSYDSFTDQQIDKAYKVKIRMTIEGKDDKDTERTTIYVVHFKKDGWKMSTYGNELDDLAPSVGSLLW